MSETTCGIELGRSDSKNDTYKAILSQAGFFFREENDLIANLANVAALLKSSSLPCFWVGFYIAKVDELVLGPFQGLPATSRIGFGLGVCGTAWKKKCTQIVPDVHLFPGHIACNRYSQSEIVVPIFSKKTVVAVLDIDSDRKDAFDETDALYLKQLTDILGENWPLK